MTKKTFNNSYSELYLITKEVYHKVMDNITNRSDKDETIETNQEQSEEVHEVEKGSETMLDDGDNQDVICISSDSDK